MCLFCDIINNPHLHGNPEDHIIDDSNNFYAKPALGHFVEGYTLINTKKHYLNMSYIDDYKIYDELSNFIEKIKDKITRFIKSDFIVFEHGSLNKFCISSSCKTPCIDHAHIHIVPTNVNIINVLKKNFSYQHIDQIHDIGKYQKNSYIYYQYKSENIVFNINKHIQSQYVRKLICIELGLPDYWNWGAHPFRDKILQFIDKY